MELLANGTVLEPGKIAAEGARPSEPFVLRDALDHFPFGRRYRATQDGVDVLVTVVDPALSARKDLRRTLILDLRSAHAVAHRNLLPIHGFGPAGIYDLCVEAGPTFTPLREFVKRRVARGKPLDAEALFAIVAHVCNALAAMHETTAHGFVNADTVLVSENGRVLLGSAGFGSVATKAPGFSALDRAKRFAIPPEQRQDPVQLGAAADIYGLAAMLAELVTGRPLARAGQRLADLGLRGPDPLVETLERATAPLVAARPPDIQTFKAELAEAIQAGAPELGTAKPKLVAPAPPELSTKAPAPRPPLLSIETGPPANGAPWAEDAPVAAPPPYEGPVAEPPTAPVGAPGHAPPYAVPGQPHFVPAAAYPGFAPHLVPFGHPAAYPPPPGYPAPYPQPAHAFAPGFPPAGYGVPPGPGAGPPPIVAGFPPGYPAAAGQPHVPHPLHARDDSGEVGLAPPISLNAHRRPPPPPGSQSRLILERIGAAAARIVALDEEASHELTQWVDGTSDPEVEEAPELEADPEPEPEPRPAPKAVAAPAAAPKPVPLAAAPKAAPAGTPKVAPAPPAKKAEPAQTEQREHTFEPDEGPALELAKPKPTAPVLGRIELQRVSASSPPRPPVHESPPPASPPATDTGGSSLLKFLMAATALGVAGWALWQALAAASTELSTPPEAADVDEP